MSNAAAANVERTLTQNLSPLSLGTLIKAYRRNIGIEYIIVGINTAAQEIYAIKHNAINQDGTIHAAVRRHKRTFKYQTLASGENAIVKGITTIVGQKRAMNVAAVTSFNRQINNSITVNGFNTVRLWAQPLTDFRNASIYN